MWFPRRQTTDRPRRIYYNERFGLGRGPITGFIQIDEWRSGDDWNESRDRLRTVVQNQLLKEATYVSIGQISFYDVWAEIIPKVRPSHWITGGFRSTQIAKAKAPIIQIPVCLGSTDEAIEHIGGPVFFAIDALPYPESLDLSQRDRAVFSLTLLSSLSIAVRDEMRSRRQSGAFR